MLVSTKGFSLEGEAVKNRFPKNRFLTDVGDRRRRLCNLATIQSGPVEKFATGPLVEISGAEPLLFVCLKGSQDKEKTPTFRLEFGGDKRDRTAVVCLPERLSKVLDKEKRPTLRWVLVEISGIEPLTS